jgi:hypothetical protein
MNNLIMLLILSVACLLWIIGNSFRGPIYNGVKDAYELDHQGEIIGSYFIVASLVLIFLAGSFL